MEFVPKGHPLFYQGDPADKFYVLIKGEISMIKKVYEERAKVRNKSFDKKRSLVSQLLEESNVQEVFRAREGKCFGEWGLIGGWLRTASCIALEDCHFMAVSKEDFEITIG